MVHRSIYAVSICALTERTPHSLCHNHMHKINSSSFVAFWPMWVTSRQSDLVAQLLKMQANWCKFALRLASCIMTIKINVVKWHHKIVVINVWWSVYPHAKPFAKNEGEKQRSSKDRNICFLVIFVKIKYRREWWKDKPNEVECEDEYANATLCHRLRL